MFLGQVLVYIHFYNDTTNVDSINLWCQAKLASFERMLAEVPDEPSCALHAGSNCGARTHVSCSTKDQGGSARPYRGVGKQWQDGFDFFHNEELDAAAPFTKVIKMYCNAGKLPEVASSLLNTIIMPSEILMKTKSIKGYSDFEQLALSWGVLWSKCSIRGPVQ